MIHLYILLCITSCLLLNAPSTHAALLPRLKASLKIPGLVFTEPAARSVEVIPFKEPPKKSHHGRGLHHTIGVVKRLVEDQDGMVEVTEDDLLELINQIDSLKQQVNGMLPSGAPDRQPSRETAASSGGKPDQLSASASDEPAEGGDQPVGLPAQASQAESPNSEQVPGPSQVPAASASSLGSSLPAQVNAASTVMPQPSSASSLLDTLGQPQTAGQSGRQPNTAFPSNPAQVPNDESANVSSEVQSSILPAGSTTGVSNESTGVPGDNAASQFDDLPNNTGAQKTDGQAQTNAQSPGEPSAIPGGVFIESPGDILQTLPSDAISTVRPSDAVPEESRQPPRVDSECADEEDVSGLPIMRRNNNCTPGHSLSTSEAPQGPPTALPLVSTTQTALTQAATTISDAEILLQTTGQQTQFPTTVGLETPVPVTGPEAISTPDTNIGVSQQLAAPTLISSPPSVIRTALSTPAHRSVSEANLSLRTLVFTSTFTRSSTVMTTTIRTEIYQPTRSPKAPGHVFKEDSGASFDEEGNASFEDSEDMDDRIQGSSNDNRRQRTSTKHFTETPHGVTPLSTTPTLIKTAIMATTTVSLSRQNTTSTTSGFRTMPKLTTSLVERGQ
ncbi:hypothetical protein F66182_11063, partial [Fusarium sp. NRRL 66182]